MTTPHQSRSPAEGTGIVHIRLSGQAEDTGALMAAFEQLATGQPSGVSIEILTRSAPYANRQSTGQRVYLLVRVEAVPAGGPS